MAYTYVDIAWLAVLLYLIDHLFFSMAIAIKTYFQKIADPADIASQAGVSFSLNHIASVIIPVTFGFLWLISPSIVFLTGAGMSAISLLLVRLIPEMPSYNNVASVEPYKGISSPAL